MYVLCDFSIFKYDGTNKVLSEYVSGEFSRSDILFTTPFGLCYTKNGVSYVRRVNMHVDLKIPIEGMSNFYDKYILCTNGTAFDMESFKVVDLFSLPKNYSYAYSFNKNIIKIYNGITITEYVDLEKSKVSEKQDIQNAQESLISLAKKRYMTRIITVNKHVEHGNGFKLTNETIETFEMNYFPLLFLVFDCLAEK